MRHIIPYFFRAGVAFYFLYPSFREFMDNTSGIYKLHGQPFFECLNKSYTNTLVTFGIWHGLFILLGLLILFWKHPFFPLLIAIIIMLLSFAFVPITPIFILTVVPVLCVAIGLTIYYTKHGEW